MTKRISPRVDIAFKKIFGVEENKDLLISFANLKKAITVLEIMNLSVEEEVVIINSGKDATFEEGLAKDVLEIITVFDARLYGSRSRKNKKLLEGMEKICQKVSS